MSHQSPPPPDRLVSWVTVSQMVGVCRSTIWKLRRQGLFPNPRKVGGRNVWRLADVIAWQATLPEAVV